MPLTVRNIVALVVFLALWILWCFFVIEAVTPWVELHLDMWRWLASWILCLIPLFVLGVVLTVRAKKSRL